MRKMFPAQPGMGEHLIYIYNLKVNEAMNHLHRERHRCHSCVLMLTVDEQRRTVHT